MEKIIIGINNIHNCNNMEIYIQCQILLEFINAYLLAQKFGVMSIPTVLIYKDRIEKAKFIGFRSKEEIEQMIKNI